MVIILEILALIVGYKGTSSLQLKLYYKIEDKCHGKISHRIALLSNQPLVLITFPGPLQPLPAELFKRTHS